MRTTRTRLRTPSMNARQQARLGSRRIFPLTGAFEMSTAFLSHLALNRSGSVVRNLIGPEQHCKALENVAHCARPRNPNAVDEPGSVDGPDLGDVDDTCLWKSCLTST